MNLWAQFNRRVGWATAVRLLLLTLAAVRRGGTGQVPGGSGNRPRTRGRRFRDLHCAARDHRPRTRTSHHASRHPARCSAGLAPRPRASTATHAVALCLHTLATQHGAAWVRLAGGDGRRVVPCYLSAKSTAHPWLPDCAFDHETVAAGWPIVPPGRIPTMVLPGRFSNQASWAVVAASRCTDVPHALIGCAALPKSGRESLLVLSHVSHASSALSQAAKSGGAAQPQQSRGRARALAFPAAPLVERAAADERADVRKLAMRRQGQASGQGMSYWVLHGSWAI